MMPASQLTRRLFWAGEALLLAATVGAAALLTRPGEWHPLPLVLLLLGLSLLGEWLTVDVSGGKLSTLMVALVLTLGLLGPAPAVAFGLAAMVLTSATRRLPPAAWLNNLATLATASFAGATVVWALAGDVHRSLAHNLAPSIVFGVVLLGAGGVFIVVNFLLFALDERVEHGRSLSRQVRELFLPLLSGELAAGALAVVLAVAYRTVGLPMLFASTVLLLIFRHLTVALLRSEERAEQLLARSRQLVRLQLGVLSTLVKALDKRDSSTGRHAAAVASYAKALAIELGCSEDQQDAVRAAGLLHDIGKFTWPDRVLRAEVVEDQDMATVRAHPQEGSVLVGALDGYGEVAEAILYHHERIDGRGYPAGLIGDEIPLASRILAICSTYDTMTAGNGYRTVMTSEEAIEELRNAASHGQLDGQLVERFVTVLEREGASIAQHADFERELEFERRVRQMAEPRDASSQAPLPLAPRLREGWRSGVRGLRERVLTRA
jgi:putative nucleotidyltransferase with HDIG domain